jgi:hypothetical protein
MPALITSLIDKVDNSEIIRDQIAAILLVESAQQQVLAAAADPAKDPRLWALRVFVERSNPWAEWQDAPSKQIDATPIVNVTYDNATADAAGSDAIERQKLVGTFHIDCYGYGVAADTVDGHLAGDHAAALESQRALRLVRNILMSAHYAYLGFPRGSSQFVASRWPQSFTMFQPAFDGRALQRVVACRLALQVEFNEFSPQVEGQPLEIISATVKRKETGEIYFKAKYGEDYS